MSIGHNVLLVCRKLDGTSLTCPPSGTSCMATPAAPPSAANPAPAPSQSQGGLSTAAIAGIAVAAVAALLLAVLIGALLCWRHSQGKGLSKAAPASEEDCQGATPFLAPSSPLLLALSLPFLYLALPPSQPLSYQSPREVNRVLLMCSTCASDVLHVCLLQPPWNFSVAFTIHFSFCSLPPRVLTNNFQREVTSVLLVCSSHLLDSSLLPGSFGVVMLVVITGRKAVQEAEDGHVNLKQWVEPLVASNPVTALRDPSLDALYDILLRLARLALFCTAMPTASPPSMSKVLGELVAVRGEIVGEEVDKVASCIDCEINTSSDLDFNASIARAHQISMQCDSSDTV
ncbi:unnamed protein product [Closterium sp. Naga37s-1]|nr:unnamed protein product [Closterium sp. Naga37s-1]